MKNGSYCSTKKKTFPNLLFFQLQEKFHRFCFGLGRRRSGRKKNRKYFSGNQVSVKIYRWTMRSWTASFIQEIISEDKVCFGWEIDIFFGKSVQIRFLSKNPNRTETSAASAPKKDRVRSGFFSSASSSSFKRHEYATALSGPMGQLCRDADGSGPGSSSSTVAAATPPTTATAAAATTASSSSNSPSSDQPGQLPGNTTIMTKVIYWPRPWWMGAHTLG